MAKQLYAIEVVESSAIAGNDVFPKNVIITFYNDNSKIKMGDGKTPFNSLPDVGNSQLSTAIQAALALKAPLNSPNFTGTLTTPTILSDKINLTSGTNKSAGSLILFGGSKEIFTNLVTSNSLIYFTHKTSGGTIGNSINYTINPGVSFTLNSDNILDTSTFVWFIIN
jgi:hypothetical protein